MHFLVLSILGKYCIRHILCGHSKIVTIFRCYVRSALQCKNVQFSIEKFLCLKESQKTQKFAFNLNIKVPLERVNLFLHVFSGLKVILTMEH